MQLTEEQYQRIARYLDAESVELTDAEMTAAEEIRQGELALGGMLPVHPSPKGMARVRRQMLAELHSSWGSLSRVFIRLAAAAAIVIAAVMIYIWRPIPTSPGRQEFGADIFAEVYSRQDDNVDLEIIADELQELETDITTSLTTGSIEAELEVIQEALDNFWLDDTSLQADES